MKIGINSETKKTFEQWNRLDIRLIFEGLLIGLISGLIVVAYRYLLSVADEVRENTIHSIKYTYSYGYIVYPIFAILMGIVLGILVKKIPNIKGSGIPQIKGFLLRQIHLDWLKELIGKFLGGIIALGFGLSAGREGPSVQLGATAALGVSKVLRRHHIEEKYLVTAGASAGLAAAFNAPLAGVIFAIEELHKSISPMMLTCILGATMVSDFLAGSVFGMKPVLHFSNMEPLPLLQYWLIIVLGIVVAIFGKFFQVAIAYSSLFYKKIIKEKCKIKEEFWPVVPMLFAIIFVFVYPIVLGGGHHVIEQLQEGNFILTSLLIVFVIKFLFTMLTYGSKVPGGIFLPLLVLGAILGYLSGYVGSSFLGLENKYIINFVALGMAGYFTAVVKAPITGTILISEMTGSFQHLLSLILVTLIAQVITDLMNSKPIYDDLMDRMLEEKAQGGSSNYLMPNMAQKSIIEFAVAFGSIVEHKKVSEITWPPNTLIVSIRRGEKEFIPKGDSKIYAGDFLIFLTNYEEDPLLIHQLEGMLLDPVER